MRVRISHVSRGPQLVGTPRSFGVFVEFEDDRGLRRTSDQLLLVGSPQEMREQLEAVLVKVLSTAGADTTITWTDDPMPHLAT